MVDRNIIDILKKYIAILNAEGLQVHKAYLFGSYSTDAASKTSDIDVMIVSDKFDENDDQAFGKAWYLTKKVNTKIEPLLIGLKRFNQDDSSPIIHHIKKEGIEIS
ncbi:MAG: nucleotidyltransferase domain-containing protein [Bacteroidota bacterium]